MTFTAFITIAVIGCSESREKGETGKTDTASVTESVIGGKDSTQYRETATDTGSTLPVPAAASEYSSLSIGELWSRYKRLRKEAEEHKKAGEFDKSIEKLLAAARCAILLNRPGIASWQYNNAGKHAIDKFMTLTDYQSHIDKLNRMEAGPEKVSYLSEFRNRMKRHEEVLQQASGLFEEAKRMNFRAPEKSREEAIAGNEAFVREAVALIDTSSLEK